MLNFKIIVRKRTKHIVLANMAERFDSLHFHRTKGWMKIYKRSIETMEKLINSVYKNAYEIVVYPVTNPSTEEVIYNMYHLQRVN